MYAPSPAPSTASSIALQGVQADIQQMWADVLSQKDNAGVGSGGVVSGGAPTSSLSDVMKDLEDTLKRTGAGSSTAAGTGEGGTGATEGRVRV